MSSADRVVGTVSRLQLQRSPMKPGPRGARVYDPSVLLEVHEVEVGPRGLRGPDGMLDAHHADHPRSRNRRLNGVSVLPRAHYDVLAGRFGPRAAVGCAGESLLLETSGPLTEAELGGTLLLDTEEGDLLELGDAVAAPPCVEFSRWLLGRSDDAVDDEVQEALAFLQDGRRGFYLTARGTGRVARGARLVRA